MRQVESNCWDACWLMAILVFPSWSPRNPGPTSWWLLGNTPSCVTAWSTLLQVFWICQIEVVEAKCWLKLSVVSFICLCSSRFWNTSACKFDILLIHLVLWCSLSGPYLKMRNSARHSRAQGWLRVSPCFTPVWQLDAGCGSPAAGKQLSTMIRSASAQVVVWLRSIYNDPR